MSCLFTLRDVGYDVAGRILFKSLNGTLGSGQSALVGPNGIGKSTLVRILTREISPTRGTLQGPDRVGHFRQREELQIDFQAEVDRLLRARVSKGVRRSIEGLLQPIVDHRAGGDRVSDLSGGEATRLRLAKAMAEEPEFMILDEPTNNLDEEGRLLVIDFVARTQVPLLIVSHDRSLLAQVDEILELSSRGLERFGVDFETYLDLRNDERQRLVENSESAKRDAKKRERERTQKLAAQTKRMQRGAADALERGLSRIEIGARKRRAQQTSSRLQLQEAKAVERGKALGPERFWEKYVASVDRGAAQRASARGRLDDQGRDSHWNQSHCLPRSEC